MKIALDVMGGDHFPIVPIDGAILALKEISDLELILVGDEKIITKELLKHKYNKSKISILHTTEYIKMEEHEPVKEIRKNKDASVNLALLEVKNGNASGCVSAGNTGAYMAASFLRLGRIKGIYRPAITTVFPGYQKNPILLDVGANSDSKVEYLEQFAIMGKIYAEILFDVKNPKVGLLNIGEEEHKGNEFVQAAYELLSRNKEINFVGNIEPTTLMMADIDVVVTDGYTGNIALKTGEAIGKLIKRILTEEVKKSPVSMIGAVLMKRVFTAFSKKMDSSEYGGAMFLGIDGIAVKAHGSSDAKAIKNAIKVANNFAKKNLIEHLKKEFEKVELKTVKVEE